MSKHTRLQDLFDCSRLDLLAETIVEAVVSQGSSMSKIYLCEHEHNGRKINFAFKLTFYRKESHEIALGEESADLMPAVDVDIEALIALKKHIIDRGLSPCIAELLFERRCTGMHARASDCKSVALSTTWPKGISTFNDDITSILCRHMDRVNAGLSHDRCALIAMEACDMTLSKFIMSLNTPFGFDIFKSILFQILHVHAVLCDRFKDFRHGDFHTDNILIKIDHSYKYDHMAPKVNVFKFNGATYAVPYFGILAKIIDFEFADIPELGIHSVLNADPSYTFYNQSDLAKLFRSVHGSIEIINMLIELAGRGFLDLPASSPMPSSAELLRHKMFADYRKDVSKSRRLATYG